MVTCITMAKTGRGAGYLKNPETPLTGNAEK